MHESVLHRPKASTRRARRRRFYAVLLLATLCALATGSVVLAVVFSIG